MPGFLGLDLGDCDAVQAEVNQVTSVCSSYLKGFIALVGEEGSMDAVVRRAVGAAAKTR